MGGLDMVKTHQIISDIAVSAQKFALNFVLVSYTI